MAIKQLGCIKSDRNDMSFMSFFCVIFSWTTCTKARMDIFIRLTQSVGMIMEIEYYD